MNNKKHIQSIDDLIISYLTENYSDEEFELLRAWIAESERNKAYFHKTREIWYGVVSLGESEFDCAIAYKRFQYRIEEDQACSQKDTMVKPAKRYFQKKWWSLAVAAMLMAVIIPSSHFLLNKESNVAAKILKDEFFTISVPYASSSQIMLPDSTKVWINAGSTLTYTRNHKENQRRVRLNGEAYFEVAKEKGVPFIVETEFVEVKVLGTKFNVNSYTDDERVDITLLEGSVALKKESDIHPVLIEPDECASYSKKERNMLIRKVDASLATQWSKGILSFEAERFDYIARRLEREYDVKIVIADTLLRKSRFYGTFDRQESITSIMNKIAFDDQMSYSINNNTITINTIQH